MNLEMINPVKKFSLADSIADELRKSIISGRLSPNTRLYEKDLAKQLGVSRGPVREALRLLEGEGLIVSSIGHGSFVNSFSERKISELYSVRIILEQEAIRLATRKADPNQLEALEEILNSMSIAAREGNLNKVIDIDLDFHKKIWEISDHNLLQQLLLSLSSQIRTYLAVQTILYQDLVDGISDHQDILLSIKNGDEEKSSYLLKQHLSKAASVVCKFAQEHEN